MQNLNYRNKDGLIVLKNLVFFLLTTESELRDDDLKLIDRVYEIYKVDIHHAPFSEITQKIHRNEIPGFESIRRCRQKIQELNPELKSSIAIAKERQKVQNEFYDFVTEI